MATGTPSRGMTRPRTVVCLDRRDYSAVQEGGVEASSFEFLVSLILNHGSPRRDRPAVIAKETAHDSTILAHYTARWHSLMGHDTSVTVVGLDLRLFGKSVPYLTGKQRFRTYGTAILSATSSRFPERARANPRRSSQRFKHMQQKCIPLSQSECEDPASSSSQPRLSLGSRQ
jgi:hypothetical protein